MHSLIGTAFERKGSSDKRWTSIGIGRVIALDVHDYDFKLHFPIHAMHQLSVQYWTAQYASIRYLKTEKDS